MQKEKKKLPVTRKVARITLKVILYLFLFVVLVFLLLWTPPVQKFLTGKVQSYLEKKLQTKVLIGSIGFGLSGNIHLQNVYIEDRTKDTLIAGGTIKAHLNYLKLFSNEVEVKDIELQNITAKIKRILPDTVFNYQFIVDAFTSEQVKKPDTAKTAPMKLSVNDLTLDNVNLTFTDVITGNDVFAHIGYATSTIDSLDPYNQRFSFPTLIVRNAEARMKQSKPLIEPKPLAVDIQQAVTPSPMHLNFGTVDLDKVNIQFDNDVSSLYSKINVGNLKLVGKVLDLQNNRIYFDELDLGNTVAAIRFGKKQQAEVAKQQVNQKVEAQKEAGWDVRIDKIRFGKDNIAFDDDNKPRLNYGMDYSHLNASDLTLNMDRFVMTNDSIGGSITKGSFKEKSGFILDALQGDLLYASKQSYLKNLYIKTPGTELRRDLVLSYPSFDALVKHFDQTVMDINIDNSRVQVKDILTFAPQLRSQPAFANPNDVWKINIVGNGSMNHLAFKSLQFDGFKDTRLSAAGTLENLMDPNRAGGNFTIYNLHSDQSDIAMLSGQKLSNKQMNLPESFDLSGTIAGNAGKFNTNLNLNSSAGFVGLNGSFGNVMNPSAATYNGTLRTNNLQVGRILRQQDQIGAITANFKFNGKGMTPDAINAKFVANISSAGFNKYNYKNIKLNGALNKKAFDVTTDINDPNIDLNLTASGQISENTSLKINGMIDSVKLEPLHFTTEPMIIRAKINGNVANLNPNYLDADILITKALFVSGVNRLNLDSIEFISGRTDTAQFMKLKSGIVNAQMSGQYRLQDLGYIMQDNIQPYFSVATVTTQTPAVQPYNIRFTADAVYTPVLSSFFPDLKKMQPVHASGSLATGQGLKATITAPYILYQTNEISKLNVDVNTDANGMHVNGNIAHIKSGNSFDIYNTRLSATALHNVINFKMGIDDKKSHNKYLVAGTFSQPSPGNMTIHLNPDSLLLNYDRWTVSPNNSITITSNAIVANNFTLTKGNQQISLQSLSGNPQPLQVKFGNFRIGTVTGFIKADSVLVDGTTNGTITFSNLTQHPLFTSDITISDLTFRQDTVGNVSIKANNAGNVYTLNTTITGKGNDVQLAGTLTPQGKTIAMDLNLNVRNLELHTVEGALKDFVTSANGKINGSVKMGGTSSDPRITGQLNFNKASISTVALGGPLTIDGQSLNVTRDGFKFNDFTIKDSASHPLRLNGEVLTANFINYEFDLDVDADNFRVINTTKRQNSIYYGQMYLTTSLRISGTEQSPAVDGSLTVEGGTNFTVVVPQTSPEVVSRQGVVEFVNFNATKNDSLFLAPYDSLNVSNLAGFDIATNIDIKKEAKFGIVIDETNGDFVNLQGEALLSAGIDPSGKVTLTGSYELTQGYYQLTYNFLQRRFDIQPGSKITWLGEPTSAQLNVTAIYVANAAPLDLVANYISAPTPAIRNTYLQKLPFQVVLKMGGQLMKPDITFDVVLPTDKNYNVSNDIITNVDTRLTQLRQEPSELNKQVFSLLLLNRFVGENPFQSSGGGFNAASFARESVSKLLTEQLNKMAEGLIQGVDINFDVASTDDYTTGELRNRTDLNVGLTKRLLNDRLTVTVGSNFELEGPQQTNQQANNFAGNIAINYQLSKDGKYMIRLYRKNDYYGVVDGYIIETGLHFIITLDYDKFAEILRRKQKVQNGTRTTDTKNLTTNK